MKKNLNLNYYATNRIIRYKDEEYNIIICAKSRKEAKELAEKAQKESKEKHKLLFVTNRANIIDYIYERQPSFLRESPNTKKALYTFRHKGEICYNFADEVVLI